jgi:hypothetical protein
VAFAVCELVHIPSKFSLALDLAIDAGSIHDADGADCRGTPNTQNPTQPPWAGGGLQLS